MKGKTKEKMKELVIYNSFENLFPELKICRKEDAYYICEEKGIDKFGQPDVWLFKGDKKEVEMWMAGAIYVRKKMIQQ